MLPSSDLTVKKRAKEEKEGDGGAEEYNVYLALCLSVWVIECWSVFLRAFVVQSIRAAPMGANLY